MLFRKKVLIKNSGIWMLTQIPIIDDGFNGCGNFFEVITFLKKTLHGHFRVSHIYKALLNGCGVKNKWNASFTKYRIVIYLPFKFYSIS